MDEARESGFSGKTVLLPGEKGGTAFHTLSPGLNRIGWIDTLKGIGILLVVLGHAWFGVTRLVDWIFTFHIPLFFAISGFLYRSGKYRHDTRSFLKSRVRTILIPYAGFALVSYGYWLVFSRGNAGVPVSRFHPLAGILYSNAIGDWLDINVALWFLTCLFVTQVLFHILERRVVISWLPAMLLLFSLIGYLDARYDPVRFPWGLNVAFTAVVFYGAGYLFRNTYAHNEIRELAGRPILVPLFLLITVAVSLLNGRADLNAHRYGNYVLFHLGAFSGIALSGLVALRFEGSSLLRFLGRNSLPLFGLHLIAAPVAYQCFNLVWKMPYERTGHSIPVGALLAVLQIGFLSAAILLVDKTFRFLASTRSIPHRVPPDRVSPEGKPYPSTASTME